MVLTFGHHLTDEERVLSEGQPVGEVVDHLVPHLGLADQGPVDILSLLTTVSNEPAFLESGEHGGDGRHRQPPFPLQGVRR